MSMFEYFSGEDGKNIFVISQVVICFFFFVFLQNDNLMSNGVKKNFGKVKLYPSFLLFSSFPV